MKISNIVEKENETWSQFHSTLNIIIISSNEAMIKIRIELGNDLFEFV